MIHGYAQNGKPSKALALFKNLNLDQLEVMHRDTFIFATILGACTDLLALSCGKQIHACILIDGLELDSVLCSSVINLYGKCGDFDCADRVMNIMNEPDDFFLSALISGCISNGEELEALLVFNKMRRKGIQEDASTVANVLSAGSNLPIIELIKQMHGHAHKFGVTDGMVVASALLDTYSKCQSPYGACKLFSELKAYDTILLNTMITVYSNCGRIEDAKWIFKTIPSKTLISRNSMLVGTTKNACPSEALDIFCQMNELDLKMDEFSLASVISACASTSSLELGEQNDKADEVTWNTMLMGYATNGYGIEALTFFSKMGHAGVRPSVITFTGVLSACDHMAWLKKEETGFML
ncbi:hypothetical protein L6164_026008 [Bauhinia variegata]|uniref:Uncharacterized protein n=1 Tax=Bauhinia variegata TaxID=167791 RepID=A0ACB9M2P8_BAUVA|nr:hypothetical protein L6164_026008 [Bauhinia variegata]